MGVAIGERGLERGQQVPQTGTWLLWVTAAWQVVIALAALVLSYRVFTAEAFVILGQPAELGRPVQVFAAAVIFAVFIVGILASVLLVARASAGRYLSLLINTSGMALSGFVVLGLWGVYGSFERIVDGVMQNATVLLGFALAYGLFIIAGRLPEDSRGRNTLETVALGIAGLTLFVFLLASGLVRGLSYSLSQYANLNTWIATAAFAIFLFLMLRLVVIGRLFNETPDERAAWQGWLMLAPNIFGFVLFFAGPLLLSLYLSFTDSSVGQVPQMNNAANYREILALEVQSTTDLEANPQAALTFGYATLTDFRMGNTRYVIGARDVGFWISMRNTLVFCLMLLPLAVLPALGMSLVLNSKLPGVNIFRAVFFLPSVAAVVGTALIWRWLYDPTIGYINYAISGLVAALNIIPGFNVEDPAVRWLTGPGVVLFSIVLLSAWQVVGYNTVLFLAGLQGIPKVLYEAAQIDGANRWQQFRNVTLPMLAPTSFFVLITTIVTGLQVFNEPYALFPSRPIPSQARTSVYYMYTQGFNEFQFGYASSIAWILFLIIFGFTLIQFRLNRTSAYD